VVKKFRQKAHRHLDTSRGGEWIRPTLNPSNKWFFGLTWVSLPNGIWIRSTVFAWLTNVTNRQTDRQTHTHIDHATPSVAIGCYR